MSYSPRKRYYKKRKYNIKDIYSPSLYNSNYPSYEQMVGRTYQQSPLYMTNTAETVIDRKKLDQMYQTLLKYKYPLPMTPAPTPPPSPLPPLRIQNFSDLVIDHFDLPNEKTDFTILDLANLIHGSTVFQDIDPGYQYRITAFRVFVCINVIGFSNATSTSQSAYFDNPSCHWIGTMPPNTSLIVYQNSGTEAQGIYSNGTWFSQNYNHPNAGNYKGCIDFLNIVPREDESPAELYDEFKTLYLGLELYDVLRISCGDNLAIYGLRWLNFSVYITLEIEEIRQ